MCFVGSVRFLCIFFFQAEDGIRYLVRSRGLGDVYKRQVVNRVELATLGDLEDFRLGLVEDFLDGLLRCIGPVSYTHLTLPTSDLV